MAGARLPRVERLLRDLGEAALQVHKGNNGGFYRFLSNRQIADQRKVCLREGRPWPFEHIYPANKGPAKPAKCKGHKHEREAVVRQQKVEANMKDMDKKIAAYRARTRLPTDLPLFDRLFMRPQELRKKYVKK